VIKEVSIIVLLFIGIFFTGFVNIVFNQSAYAHCFLPNDTANFIALIYRADTELTLVNNNFPSNVTLALDHAKETATLMNYVYRFDEEVTDDSDFIRKYNEVMSSRNSTVYAMVLADILDEVLRKYGKAYDIDYDLTNMSNMIFDTRSSSSFMNMHQPSQHSNMTEKNNNNNNSSSLVNIADYQSAKELSERAYQIFKNKLEPLSMSNGTNNSIVASNLDKLEKSLVNINNLMMMNNKEAAAGELMKIVHVQVHPVLQATYNLQLKK
jgi:hypothetical protein